MDDAAACERPVHAEDEQAEARSIESGAGQGAVHGHVVVVRHAHHQHVLVGSVDADVGVVVRGVEVERVADHAADMEEFVVAGVGPIVRRALEVDEQDFVAGVDAAGGRGGSQRCRRAGVFRAVTWTSLWGRQTRVHAVDGNPVAVKKIKRSAAKRKKERM
jgi:hypothetical protein